jgi:hypothetical protein
MSFEVSPFGAACSMSIMSSGNLVFIRALRLDQLKGKKNVPTVKYGWCESRGLVDELGGR